jgi:type IX secretion system substrate protein
VFLNGFTPATSYIIVAFSSSTNPNDPWNLFALSGNPLNDNTWSDYPAVAITKDELFITINQLNPDSSWQTGFVQTLIWQMDKNAAFDGDTTINTLLWSDIKFAGKTIRYFTPMKGGTGPKGPNMYFLSNQNFGINTDTIFVAEISDNISSNAAAIDVKRTNSSVKYGMPPQGRQTGGHILDTNDDRILGGFYENGKIQFVGNTAWYPIAYPDTFLYAGIYHGFVDSLDSDQPVVTANIIYDPDTILDLGYPNIAFSGNQYCEDEAIITFNYTAPSVFSGSSAIYYANDGSYSDFVTLKTGDNYVDILAGTYERWGDYSGIQRKFNEEGVVWASTSWGNTNKRNATWISELFSPDTSHSAQHSRVLVTSIDTINPSVYNLCDGALGATAIFGVEPYAYLWSDPDSQTTAIAEGLCDGIYNVTITDANNCSAVTSASIEMPPPDANLFPNPVSNTVSINFVLAQEALIDVGIYSVDGKLLFSLLKENAKEGRNLFTFSTAPLAQGVYILKLMNAASGEEVFTEKFMKLK